MNARCFLLIVVAVTGSVPALAFDTRSLGYGSLFLDDIKELVGSSPQLKKEIQDALAEANKKPEEQLCESPRFPGPWKELHGEHVAPFTCNIGTKWLTINATVRVTGPKGQVFDKASNTAMKRATKVSQTKPTWQWTSADPRESK
jgi:hypothetical protein